MPADDAMMATLNTDADAANDLGSQNAFYDPNPNVHVGFNDTSILHQQHHFAPWDISPFPHNIPHVPQINPFEIPTAPEGVPSDTGPIMTRRRRAILHRQSALIEPDSSTAAAQVSFSLFTRHIFSAYHVHYLLYFLDVYLF
jgi:hypothetical protein